MITPVLLSVLQTTRRINVNNDPGIRYLTNGCQPSVDADDKFHCSAVLNTRKYEQGIGQIGKFGAFKSKTIVVCCGFVVVRDCHCIYKGVFYSWAHAECFGQTCLETEFLTKVLESMTLYKKYKALNFAQVSNKICVRNGERERERVIGISALIYNFGDFIYVYVYFANMKNISVRVVNVLMYRGTGIVFMTGT